MFTVEELKTISNVLEDGDLKVKVNLIKDQLELQAEFQKKALEIRSKLEKLVKE